MNSIIDLCSICIKKPKARNFYRVEEGKRKKKQASALSYHNSTKTSESGVLPASV